MKRAKVATEGSSVIKNERNHRNWKEGSVGAGRTGGYSADSAGVHSGRCKEGAGRWGALGKVQRRGWVGSPQSQVNRLLVCCPAS